MRLKFAGLMGALLLLNFCGLAQDDKMTLIRGRFASQRVPEEVSLNMVRNGETVLHSKVKVAKDGAFGFYLQPEYSGFYTVGDRGDAARLYLTPGRSVQLTLTDGSYTVNASDKENTLLANWAKTIWELKKCNQLRGNYTYKEIFPILPALEQAKNETLAAGKSGNAEFDQLFAKLVPAEFEYELYHFLYMPRTINPKSEDYPEIYRKISSLPRFTDDSALNFEFGMSYVGVYLLFQRIAHKDELQGSDAMAENCLKNIPDATVRGWYMAKNVLTRAKAYDDAYTAKLDKYRKYLVTEDQRKFVSDFVLTINKTATGEPSLPFDGTTPDRKKMSLADFKGKVVLVDVWATWCGPCRAQTPFFKKMADEMNGTDVAFISYSIDDLKDTEKWKKMIVDEKMDWVQLIGEAAFKSQLCVNYKITAIPRFMVFDKKGNIVSIDAPRPSTPELKPLLEKYLK